MKKLANIWNMTMAHTSEILSVYIAKMVLGIFLGLVVFCELDNYLGNSLALDRLAVGFDRSVFMDLVNTQKDFLTGITFYIFPLIVIYLLIGIILQGGLLSNIVCRESGIGSQMKSGLRHFLPLVGYFITSTILMIVVGLLIFVPFMLYAGDPLTTFHSEKPFVLSIIGLIVTFIMIVIPIWAWSVLARLAFFSEHSFFQSMKVGSMIVKRNIIKIIAIGFLLMGIHVLLSFVYYMLMGDHGAASWVSIVLLFVVQQIFALIRTYLRAIGYVTLAEVSGDFKKKSIL